MSELATMAMQDTADDLNGRFLTFYIGDSVFGLELMHVIEIISVQSATGVPNVPSYIKGIINLRGKIVPVIDVRLKFNQEQRAYDDKTCIIVVVIEEMHVGLIVDRVSEVVTVAQEDLAPPPEMGAGGSAGYLGSVSQVGNRVVLNIDCQRFFRTDLLGSNL